MGETEVKQTALQQHFFTTYNYNTYNYKINAIRFISLRTGLYNYLQCLGKPEHKDANFRCAKKFI